MTNDMDVSNKSFHLRWNNHLENLRALFECLFNEQILVDVTIACQDGLLRVRNLRFFFFNNTPSISKNLL